MRAGHHTGAAECTPAQQPASTDAAAHACCLRVACAQTSLPDVQRVECPYVSSVATAGMSTASAVSTAAGSAHKHRPKHLRLLLYLAGA